MFRRNKSLDIIREYRPDPDRCLKALMALLRWESPDESTAPPPGNQDDPAAQPEEQPG